MFSDLREKTKKIVNHQGVRRYGKSTSWFFAAKVFQLVVGLLVSVWVARYLGPKNYGLLSYTQAFVGLFSAFATLGLEGILVRELVKNEKKRDELLGTAFWLRFIGALLMIGLIAIVVQFTSNDQYTNILIFIVAGATIFQAFNVIDFYFQAKVLGKYSALATIISLFISSIVRIILILQKASLIAFAWVIVFDSVTLAFGYLYFYLKSTATNHHHFRFKFNKSTAVSLLKDSWPLILSSIAITIYMRIDQVMLQSMLGNEAVGQYSAAVRISEAWYFIPTVITSSLFPAIINAKKKSEELYYARLQRLYDLMVWMAIAIALPMTFLSDWVINLLYGSAYSQAGSVLMIHIWAGVNVAVGTAWSKWILNENKQLIALYAHLLGAFLNIFFNFYLIDLYGIKGAALATLLSSFISALFSYSLYKPKISYSMFLKSLQVWRIFKKNDK